jgi:hypothetical protein
MCRGVAPRQQVGNDALHDDWREYGGLAELGMEERAAEHSCMKASRRCNLGFGRVFTGIRYQEEIQGHNGDST